MDQITNKHLESFISELVKNNHRVKKAFLFGSYAKNTDNPESDIDIAFVIEKLTDEEKFDFQVQLLLLASKYDTRIEPHVISTDDLNSNNPFVVEILKTGIEINTHSPLIANEPREDYTNPDK